MNMHINKLIQIQNNAYTRNTNNFKEITVFLKNYGDLLTFKLTRYFMDIFLKQLVAMAMLFIL